MRPSPPSRNLERSTLVIKNTLARLLTASALVAGGSMLLPDPAVAQAGFHVVNMATGKCATPAGGVSTDNNVTLVQYNCDNDASRHWYLGNWSNNTFQLVNAKTGKCATVAGGVSTANNVTLVQYNCDNDSSRRWRLSNGDGSSYQFVNVKTGKCATVAGGVSADNNVTLVQYNCDNDRSRRWQLA
ncbi:RICIN domain-containing protein [Kitasatospora sp. NPDC048298]|uniref:RICIN domain-containing protein n=1 Tax=Kitasatospora sp. NPDC048298 TaxID=3364049 RepID=UPI0037119BD4